MFYSMKIGYVNCKNNMIKPSCQILWPAMSRVSAKHLRQTRALFVVVGAAATALSARDGPEAASRVGYMHCAVPKPAPRVVAIVRRGGGRLPSVAGGWRRFGCAALSLQSPANDCNADKCDDNEVCVSVDFCKFNSFSNLKYSCINDFRAAILTKI